MTIQYCNTNIAAALDDTVLQYEHKTGVIFPAVVVRCTATGRCIYLPVRSYTRTNCVVFSIVVQNHTHTERGTSSYEYGPPLPARPLDRAVALLMVLTADEDQTGIIFLAMGSPGRSPRRSRAAPLVGDTAV